MQLTHEIRQAWETFLRHAQNRGHVQRELELLDKDLETHVQACWRSSLLTAQRIQQDLPDLKPRCILEVGSSTGLKCLALQQVWPDAQVIGVEPEEQAVTVARSMAQTMVGPTPQFILGYGESLPLPNASVDLVICHTVIEHVQDVERVIAEMARVLSGTGKIHLEAPNYIWPYEPHLGVWCLPMLGKATVRFMAALQGQRSQLGFLDHLQFVTPGRLEKAFRSNGLTWCNLVEAKLNRVFTGDSTHIQHYRRLAKLLHGLHRLGMGSLLVKLVMGCGFYPSLIYTTHRQGLSE
jgi:ubiquinone/menaquinone biosynthesis C-methylase UbiE